MELYLPMVALGAFEVGQGRSDDADGVDDEYAGFEVAVGDC
jgi:hypothetical protein